MKEPHHQGTCQIAVGRWLLVICVVILNQDWRRGAEFFEHYLIDYDVADNIGNWMYIAGS